MAGGEVLMGTLRWEKEQAVAAEQERERLAQERRQRELGQREAEIQARMVVLRRELDTLQFEHSAVTAEETAVSEQYLIDQAELGRRRGLDAASAEADPAGRETLDG
jgi:circadian clock protein KaiC